MIIERDGLLDPLEIKKASTPTLSMISGFDVLKKASIPMGMGGIICLKEKFTALDKDTLVIPVWTI